MHGLLMWVIYKHPGDYPDHYVVRRFVCGVTEVPDRSCQVAGTLEAARALVPAGKTNIGRQPEDPPQIAEVWV